MAWLCTIFGHEMPEQGWWGDGLYGKVIGGKVDGIGRTHYAVEQECRRCGKSWVTARFHG